MVIKVKSYATMRQFTAHLPPDGDLEIPEGATVDHVLKRLRVPSESKKIILVNGRHQPADYKLRPGDLLVLFPPLEGG